MGAPRSGFPRAVVHSWIRVSLRVLVRPVSCFRSSLLDDFQTTGTET